MGFKRQMMNMMIAGKSPAEIAEIAAEIMPEVIAKVGPEGMARLIEKVIPGLVEKTSDTEMQHITLNIMPRIMDSSFSGMNAEQRRFVLPRMRSILNSMEKKYLRD